eukprot:GEMP01047623.1.p1 GENE.GEMP01047623.1~~GEMP01047623.1.p1  ORF type:complete len:259 (+),score=37.41 GEMP01047623.1:313-1089(+)
MEGSGSWARIKLNDEYVAEHEQLKQYIERNERSLDALGVVKEVINLNPAHYMAWQFRRECLLSCGMDIDAELDSIGEMCSRYPKTYQLWYHRRWCLERIIETDPSDTELEALRDKELCFIRFMLDLDKRSYHAWSHRQTAITILRIPVEEELVAITDIISSAPENNSAWNHRHFLVQFALSMLRKDATLESIWTYLDAFVDDYSTIDISFVEELNHFVLERSISFDSVSTYKILDKLTDVDPLHSKLWNWKRTLLDQS